jgi:ABC-type lipoprotein release transport system permease subunit
VNGADISYSAGLTSMPTPLAIGIRPATYLAAAAFLAVVAALASVFPARRAARRRIPDALAHV